MTHKLWIDPPSGHRYGFPKIWDPVTHPAIDKWLIEKGYPAQDIDFALDFCRQWPVAETEPAQEAPPAAVTELREVLADLRDEFQQWEADFANERTQFWNSLTKKQQLLAFCEVVNRLTQAELVDRCSYRGVLYDAFGFGPESYVCAQMSGFLDLHNAIERK